MIRFWFSPSSDVILMLNIKKFKSRLCNGIFFSELETNVRLLISNHNKKTHVKLKIYLTTSIFKAQICTGGPPLTRKSLKQSPTSVVLAYVCGSGGILCQSLEQSHLCKFCLTNYFSSPKIRVWRGAGTLCIVLNGLFSKSEVMLTSIQARVPHSIAH